MTYIPEPEDTSKVVIPEALEALTEKLARNTHEVWSAGRIREGWRYGDHRDDALRMHPCLVPYDELPEKEKEYDRATSLETVKLILSLGYSICPPRE